MNWIIGLRGGLAVILSITSLIIIFTAACLITGGIPGIEVFIVLFVVWAISSFFTVIGLDVWLDLLKLKIDTEYNTRQLIQIQTLLTKRCTEEIKSAE